MLTNTQPEYRYHLQTGEEARRRNGANRLPQPDPHPEEAFHKHVRNMLIGLAFMVAFLVVTYILAVKTWDWQTRRLVSAIPEIESDSTNAVLSRKPDTETLPPQSLLGADALQRAELIAREGDLLAESGNFKASIEAYTQALAIWPDLASAYPKLGRAHLRSGNYNRARYALQKAAQLYPNAVDVINDLGVACFYIGRYHDAAAQFDAALTLAPDYAIALYNKALCRRALGDMDGARSTIDALLRKRPQDARALREKAFFLAADGKLEGALETLLQAMDVAPEWPGAHYDAAAAAALLGRWADTQRFLEKAETLTSSPSVYLFLQQPAFNTFRSTEIGQSFEKGLLRRAQTSPKSAQPLYKPSTPELLTSFTESLST